jgi:hypothetical protein
VSQEISNIQVVVLAAFALGADEHPVDLEAIAIHASKLAPGRFAWRTKADWINLIAVFDSLRDAKKSRSGRLMGGSNETGWYLTKAGIEWAGRHKKLATLRRKKGASEALKTGVRAWAVWRNAVEEKRAKTLLDRNVLSRERIGNDDFAAPPALLIRAFLSRRSPRPV